MGKSKVKIFYAACIGMGFLILDSRTALEGAYEGINLILEVLLPSLFPFIFLSIVITASLHEMKLKCLKPIQQLFHIPEGTEALLISAFLGGYPAGAQAVCQAYRSGQLSRENSEKMLSFCNNAGPSFLFGMASAFFSAKWMIWALWIFHILGALAAARIYSCTEESGIRMKSNLSLSVTEMIKQAIAVVSVICGWVVLFRVVIAFADKWFLWMVPVQIRTILVGLLELSNGICELQAISNEKIRFLVCSAMISAGGVCVGLQTESVTEGLGKTHYYRGKAIQLCVSVSCAAILMYHLYFIIPVLLIPFVVPKKRSGNPVIAGV